MSESKLAAELRDLFPLPLVPFENMMRLDDRESHPMTCGAEFTFEGHFDKEKLSSAVRRTCLRHPLFCANLQKHRGNRWRWIAAAEPPTVRWVHDAAAVDYDRASFIDLRSEVGLRISAQTTSNSTRLIFDFHHACADGAGGLAFIEDLLSLYAASFSDCPQKLRNLPPVKLSLLRRRGNFPRGTGSIKQRLLGEVSNACQAVQFIAQRPQPLVFSSTPQLKITPAVPPQRLSRFSFEAGFLTQLRATAAEAGATVNDLLIQALLLTIADWNRKHKTEQPQDQLRILMPMNLRTRQDLEMSAANRMSYAIVTRRMKELTNQGGLLKSISLETSKLRRNRMPQRALSLLSLLDKVPHGISSLFSPATCLATAVLSNVGDPIRRFRSRFPRDRGLIVVGNVRLTNFTAVTPVRPLTRAAFFVNSYANRLTIGARLDPTVATPTDAALLLEQFANRLAAPAGMAQHARAA